MSRTREYWKDIEKFEGRYQISDLGRVKSLEFRNGNVVKKRVKLIRPFYNKNGYTRLALGVGKRYSVHELVCEAFNGKKEEGQEVCHLNGNPFDNRACNLMWGTRTENHLQTSLHLRRGIYKDV